MGNQGRQKAHDLEASELEDVGQDGTLDGLDLLESTSRRIPARTEQNSGWAMRAEGALLDPNGLESNSSGLDQALAFASERVEAASSSAKREASAKRRTLDPAKYAGPEFDDDPRLVESARAEADWSTPSALDLQFARIPMAPLPRDLLALHGLTDTPELTLHRDGSELDPIDFVEPIDADLLDAELIEESNEVDELLDAELTDESHELEELAPDEKLFDNDDDLDEAPPVGLRLISKPPPAPVPLSRSIDAPRAEAATQTASLREASGAIDFESLSHASPSVPPSDLSSPAFPSLAPSLEPAKLSTLADKNHEAPTRRAWMWIAPLLLVGVVLTAYFWPSPAPVAAPVAAAPAPTRVLPRVVPPADVPPTAQNPALDEAEDITPVQTETAPASAPRSAEPIAPANRAATPAPRDERPLPVTANAEATHAEATHAEATRAEATHAEATNAEATHAEASNAEVATVEADLPLQPSREEVQDALNSVRDAVRACMPTGGRVPVEVTIVGRTGRVVRAEVQSAAFARQPMGGCIASAVRGARVAPFEQARLVVTYPYVL